MCQLTLREASLGAALCLVIAWGLPTLLRAGATLRALAWTPVLSRPLARFLRPRAYSEDEFFRADGCDELWVARRRAGFERLAAQLRERGGQSIAFGSQLRDGFSDLRFADASRVPPPFADVMRQRFDLAAAATASDGPRLRDLDGRWTLDVSGSYGVNVFGYERYKRFIERAEERVRELGPVLGPIHPVVAENIELLREVSGAEEISFHASGTEAVMAAVRLVRFNTVRKLIVTFSGAYHGWWDGVQPGVGNERQFGDCLVLKDMSPASLRVLRRRRKEIAGVLVNPIQCFHPNSPPPNDATLLTSEIRTAADTSAHYREWLHELRGVCTECEIPLVFDEVYSGFRLARGGAQEFFGVRADLVLYGKTVAGGLPIGVVCGPRKLMRRFDPDRPLRIAYVIGTFSAHPLVMAGMDEFLPWVRTPEAENLYKDANERCRVWASQTNAELSAESLPTRITHLGTVWTVTFEEPSRYNWLLQYYLRAEGLTLSWVGTGRCLASFDYTDADYAELRTKLLDAVRAMRRDGWWVTREEQPQRDRKMRAALFRELATSFVPPRIRDFGADVMRRKRDDHKASHNQPTNRALHLLSSSVFMLCYGLLFADLTLAMFLGLAALIVRQLGHAVFEPPCHEEEKLLLGFTTKSKSVVVGVYLALPLLQLWGATGGVWETIWSRAPTIALHWFVWTLAVVGGHVLQLVHSHGFRSSMIWFIKLATDPMTDVVTYRPRLPLRALRH